ncbi:MAG: hypothetical protein ACJ8EP_01195 [Sphingomicrobium sp.]
MRLSVEESVIVARLRSQGCSLDAGVSTAISLAMRCGGAVFFIPRDEGDCYQPAHFRKIANEVERWGLELLPLDYHLVG